MVNIKHRNSCVVSIRKRKMWQHKINHLTVICTASLLLWGYTSGRPAASMEALETLQDAIARFELNNKRESLGDVDCSMEEVDSLECQQQRHRTRITRIITHLRNPNQRDIFQRPSFIQERGIFKTQHTKNLGGFRTFQESSKDNKPMETIKKPKHEFKDRNEAIGESTKREAPKRIHCPSWMSNVMCYSYIMLKLRP
ncbi:unnamed protein product [Owenia fusiformis]|uniref:Uncharacterized protein n=1 Tax=Owenia fusiformis TaxID=6347 RepID=A0A8J1T5X8_OWEFU|nr:unnamed protein product [Owenia fusiformis]